MRFCKIGTFALALALAGGTLLGTGAARAQQEREDFDEWTKLCQADDQGRVECFVFQNVNAKETGKSILHLTVVKVPEAERPILVATVPLGVLLPPGLVLSVDDQEMGRLQIQVCSPNGCQSQIQFSDDLLQRFKGGLNGTVKLVDPAGQEVHVPFSLKGFTAALNSLG